MIIVFAPFTVIVFGNAKALGFGKGNVGEEGGETMMREEFSGPLVMGATIWARVQRNQIRGSSVSIRLFNSSARYSALYPQQGHRYVPGLLPSAQRTGLFRASKGTCFPQRPQRTP